jgi:WD40 repeat protein
MVEEQPKQQVP